MSRTQDIETILARHREWLRSGGATGEKADFSGQSPGAIDLSGADLRYASFERANLQGADLSLSDLQWTSFEGAQLTGANLRSAKLISADLREANLSHADLREATLIDADLTEARLIRADLRRASFLGAKLARAHLQEANLEDAYLANAELRYADLTEAKLPRACLRNALLEKTVLRDTALNGTDFENADLRGADLRGARYLGNDALRRGTNWREAKRDGVAIGVGGFAVPLRFVVGLVLIAGLASVIAFAWVASFDLPRNNLGRQRAEAPPSAPIAATAGRTSAAPEEAGAAEPQSGSEAIVPLPRDGQSSDATTARGPETEASSGPAGAPPASWTPTEEGAAGAPAAQPAAGTPPAAEPDPPAEVPPAAPERDQAVPGVTVELGPPPTAPDEPAEAASSGPVRGPTEAPETAEAPGEEVTVPAPWQPPSGASEDGTPEEGSREESAAAADPTDTTDEEIEPVPGRFIAARDSNVRSGPSTRTRAVAVIPKGAEVRVLGRHKQLRWYKVALADGTMGYIYVPLLRQVEAPRTTPDVVSASTEPATNVGSGAGATPQLAARPTDGDPQPSVTAGPAADTPVEGRLTETLLEQLRSTGSCIRCDLRGLDLRGLDLSGTDLSGADLRNADLRGADLSRTSLLSSNLIGADLSGAKLVQTTLNGANLSGADLGRVDLSGARLGAARGLTQGQLAQSCGDDRTQLPRGLSIPTC